jgi:hypothetical protein
MDRGHNRKTVFGDDADRPHFLGFLRRYQHRFRLRLYHWCLMSNRSYLLVQLCDKPMHCHA